MRAWLVIAGVLVACSKDRGASSRDEVVAAWKKGGLEASPLAAAKTDVGADCSSTTVSKLDVLVCMFKTAQEAAAAEAKGFAWVGDTTGAAKAQGELLIVVADRKKVDPRGKTIHQVLTLPAK